MTSRVATSLVPRVINAYPHAFTYDFYDYNSILFSIRNNLEF